MMTRTTKTGLLASAALALVAAAPQDAQTAPTLGNFSLPPSAPAPAPSPTPAGPVITLPTLTPTPTPTPTPSVTPSPRATPSPKPTPRATPDAPAAELPRSVASPTPATTPTSTAEPSALAPPPVSIATPTPTAAPSPPATLAGGGFALWLILGIPVLIVLLGAAVLWWRRRRDAAAAGPTPAKRAKPPRPQPPAKRQTAVVPPPTSTDPSSEAPSFWTPSQPARLPEPVAPAPPPPPPVRPHIEIGIAPRRAGLNLLSATAEVEVLVRNEGDAAATNIAIDVRLMNAQSEQDSQLGALFAAAMGKSAVPPFEVAPGEEQAIRAVATLPRDAIVPLMAADRPMFVPILTVDVRYDRGDGSRAQTAAAFMIGVVRDGSDKLAPFWLDTAPRMFDTIAVRPHAFSVRS